MGDIEDHLSPQALSSSLPHLEVQQETAALAEPEAKVAVHLHTDAPAGLRLRVRLGDDVHVRERERRQRRRVTSVLPRRTPIGEPQVKELNGVI